MPVITRRSWIFAGIALAAFALLVAGSAALLVRSGEYADLDDIIYRQKETTGLYGPAVHDRTFYYKLHLYEEAKPAVAVLGSQNVLQMRQESFSKPFVNMGGMKTMDEAAGMARESFDLHRPELLLLGVDLAWFHPAAEKPAAEKPSEDASPAADILRPFFWLAAGKMSPASALRILGGTSPHSGMAAHLRGDGYSLDGSYHDSAVLTGIAPSADEKFAATLKTFNGSGEISEQQWQKFTGLLDFLKDENVKTIVFFPPLAPAVLRETGGYAYLAAARGKAQEAARERGFAFFDFSDPIALGAQDCEFIDGLRGGAVVSLRLLLNMAVDNETLRDVVRLPEVGWGIQNYGGQASLLENEVDFLKLGCVK